MLRLKAKELSADLEFKASVGWYNNWKCRQAVSMRAKTTLAQLLPADMENKVVKFHRFVLRARRRHNYELSHILNMDETPMQFELPATRTLEFTGNRTVPILSCGGDKQNFAVIAAGHQPAAGHILERFEIFHSMVPWFNVRSICDCSAVQSAVSWSKCLAAAPVSF